MTGYDALHHSAAWLDVSTRGRITMLGEDRARLLHAMTTNQIQQLTPGTGCYAFFLTAQGRLVADVNILCRPDHLLLDLEPETREKIYQHLDHYIIADDVTLEDVTGQTAAIAVAGPKAARVLESAGAPLVAADYANVEWGSRIVARLPLAFLIVAPIEEKDQLVAQLESAGAAPADAEEFRVFRIEHGTPRYGDDLSERFLAQEANQPHALNFSKGCYLGQEIVERVRSRGQVHRVLMPLLLDTKTPPSPGSKLQIGEAAAAEITSSAYSPALDKVVALAYVRTEHARPHTHMTLGDTQAEVAELARL